MEGVSSCGVLFIEGSPNSICTLFRYQNHPKSTDLLLRFLGITSTFCLLENTFRPEAKQGLCFFGLAEMTETQNWKNAPELVVCPCLPCLMEIQQQHASLPELEIHISFPHNLCHIFCWRWKMHKAILVWFSPTETCLHSHDVQLPKPSPILSLPKSRNRYPKTPKRNFGICAEVDAPLMTVMIGDIVGYIVFGSSTPAAHAWTGHSSPTNLSESQPGSALHTDSPK